MFKIVALVGVLGGFSLLGAVKSAGLKERIRLLEEYLQMLTTGIG